VSRGAETLSSSTIVSSSGRVRRPEEFATLLAAIPRPQPVEVTAPVERPLNAIRFVLTGAVLMITAGLLANARDIEDPAAVRLRIEQEVGVLAGLVERYHAEAHKYPDAAAWRISVGREDHRFFDPWHRPYLYRIDDETFSIGSYGADGQPGGEGVDQDVERSFPRRKTVGAFARSQRASKDQTNE
jgi:Type II secretion system (T2SS), protein G